MHLFALRIKLILTLLLWSTFAFAQGGGGSVLPQGVITPGNCTKFGTSKFFVADAGACNSSGITGFAIPTVAVGISPSSAGVLTTALRSDAKLILDQTAAYVFTGLGATNLLTGSLLSWNNDLFLIRTAAASLQAGNTDVDTNAAIVAQTWRSQGALAGGTSNQAGKNWTFIASPGKGTGAGGSFIFQTTPAGSTGTVVGTPTTQVTVSSTGVTIPSLSTTTLSVSSGTSAINQITLVAGNSLLWTGRSRFNSPADGVFAFQNNGQTLTANISVPANDTHQFGLANAAVPVPQTLQAQGSRAGTDSNISGANLTIRSGAGTGIGAITSLILQSPVVVASGTGVQTQTTGLTINNGTAVTVGYTVATLPATALTGARAHVTDQLTTCAAVGAALIGVGAVVCPVFYNGAAWVGG